MKKQVIASLMSIVMIVGSAGGSSVFAAETTAQEAVEIAQEEGAEELKEELEESEDTDEGGSPEDAEEEAARVEEVKPVEEEAEAAITEKNADDEEAEDSDDKEERIAEFAESEESIVDEAEAETSNEKEAVLDGDAVDSGTCGDSATWTLTGSDDYLTLTISGSGSMYDYDQVDERPWYLYRSSIVTVIIKDNITKIGKNAFINCQYLTRTSIPDSVTSIGDSAFYGCYGLTSVTIPDSVTSIGRRAFSNCSRLWAITIPDGVTSIKEETFRGCDSLEEITIPDSVTSIEKDALSMCYNLKTIHINSLEAWLGIDTNEIISCDLVLNNEKLTNVVIPDGITRIRAYAFRGNNSITSVSIPDSVKEIGESAFYSCRSLTDVLIGNGVESIGVQAFDGCISLKSFTIPSGVKRIEDGLFCRCSSLVSVEIPDGMTTIRYHAFAGCTGLTSICIPDSVTYISKNAFNKSTEIPDFEEEEILEPLDNVVLLVTNDSYAKEYAIEYGLQYRIVCVNHSWNEDYTIDKEATCTDEGSKSIHCSICDTIDETSIIVIPKKEHNYGDWNITKEAACTTEGSKERACAVCGHKERDAIPATGHKWSNGYTADKEATCLEEGSESIHCLVCDEINTTTVRDIPKREHNYADWTVTKEASCTDTGSRERICTNCGDKNTEEIPAAGHQWNEDYTIDKEPTVMEEGSKSIHCSVCEAIKEGSEIPIPKKQNTLGKTTRGDLFNLANNIKVTWEAVPGAKYYKVYRNGVSEPVIVTTGLVGWDTCIAPKLEPGKMYTYKIVASLTGKGDSSGDSKLSYSKSIYRLQTTAFKYAKNTAPGKVTVSYKKSNYGDSYVILYADNKDMKNAKSKVIYGADTTAVVLGGFKKGKTYWFQIRVRKSMSGYKLPFYTTFGVQKSVKITQ